MWAALYLSIGALVALGAALHSLGAGGAPEPSLELQQEQAIVALVRDTVRATTLARTVAYSEDLSLRGRPEVLPPAALYGRLDIFASLGAIDSSGHEWVPAMRVGPSEALPPLPPGQSVSDRNAYEVGLARCDRILALAAGDPIRQMNVCAAGGTSFATFNRYVLVVKAGWLGPGQPTPLLNPRALRDRLTREFGTVNTVRLEAWRVNGTPAEAVDSFIVSF